MTSKPRGYQMDLKCSQNVPAGVQSGYRTENCSKMWSQGAPKMTPKSHFGGSWGTGATQRGSRGFKILIIRILISAWAETIKRHGGGEALAPLDIVVRCLGSELSSALYSGSPVDRSPQQICRL